MLQICPVPRTRDAFGEGGTPTDSASQGHSGKFLDELEWYMQSADISQEGLLALAAGSTIAGNITPVGAASNVIIAQAAERCGEHLGLWRFFAVGAPLTLLNLLVYWWFL